MKEQYLEQLKALPQDKISKVVVTVLLVYIAWLLAGLSWHVIPTTQTGGNIKPVSTTQRAASSAPTSVSVQSITVLNLFGEANKKPAPKPREVANVTNAPKTKLNVKLTGVVAIDDKPTEGSAIIQNGNSQDTYFYNDRIGTTSAVVNQIFADRVILKVGSKFETLMLDGIEYSKKSQTASTKLSRENARKALYPDTYDEMAPPKKASDFKKGGSRKIDNRRNKELTTKMTQQKQDILKDPKKLFDFLQVTPVKKNGQLAGYKLRPGKDPKLFIQSGLRSNDLAVEINGYALNDMQQAMNILRELKDMTEARITVERRGERVEVLFSVDNNVAASGS